MMDLDRVLDKMHFDAALELQIACTEQDRHVKERIKDKIIARNRRLWRARRGIVRKYVNA